MTKNRLFAAVIAAAVVLPGSAMATNGMFMTGNGMKAKGMAGVGIALPQDAVSGATNPAGLSNIGNRVDFGIEMFQPDRSASITGNNGNPLAPAFPGMLPTSYDFDKNGNGDGPFYIPDFGISYDINDSLTFGFSVVGAGGMNTNYNGIIPFNGAAYPVETGINLEQVLMTPALSWKMNENHSFGAGLVIAYQQFKAYGLQGFTGTNSQPVPSPPGPPGQVFDPQVSAYPDKLTNKGRDDSWGVGLSLGWQGQITDRLSLAATYHSKVDMDEFSDYKGLFAEKGDLDIPEWYGLGVAFQATDALTVGFDIQQINYSGVDSIGNKLQSGNCGMPFSGGCMFVPTNYLGTDNGSGFGWDDMTVYKLGFQYEVTPKVTLRAGWSHADQPVSKDQTFFNIMAPAVIEDHGTIGATFTLDNGSEVSMFYMHAFHNKVKGSNSIPQAFGGGEADIEMSQDAIGLGYGWKF